MTAVERKAVLHLIALCSPRPEVALRGKTGDLHLPGLYPFLWAAPQEGDLHSMALASLNTVWSGFSIARQWLPCDYCDANRMLLKREMQIPDRQVCFGRGGAVLSELFSLILSGGGEL